MKTVKIRLSSIEAVRDFVEIVRKYDSEVDLSSGRYVVDAKSIMGIFSLDLSKDLELRIHSAACGEFLDEIKDFIVE